MWNALNEALCACMGLQPGSREAVAFIREMYRDPENVPQFARNENVIFYNIESDYSEPIIPASYDAVGKQYGSNLPKVDMFSPYKAIIVCYGPNSEIFAKQIRARLYFDGPNFPLRILRYNGMYPIPDPPQPIVLYESEGSLWRKRADLTIRFRVCESFEASERRGTVEIAPVINIHQAKGG